MIDALRTAILQAFNAKFPKTGIEAIFLNPDSDEAREYWKRFDEICKSEEFLAIPDDAE